MTTISNAILTHYTAPIFVAILAPFLIKERLEKITVISLILSFIGIIMIAYSSGISLESENFIGILLGIVSGVFYAFSIIIYKYLMKDLPAYTLIFYQSFFGSIILSIFVYNQIFLPLQSMLFLFVFALLFGLAATFLYFQGIKRVKAQHAGIMGYTEPVAGTIYAFLFFSEVPGISTLLGGALIVLGGYLVIRSQK
jgi:drug/metabolite transporter (DMT)-like permease